MAMRVEKYQAASSSRGEPFRLVLISIMFLPGLTRRLWTKFTFTPTLRSSPGRFAGEFKVRQHNHALMRLGDQIRSEQAARSCLWLRKKMSTLGLAGAYRDMVGTFANLRLYLEERNVDRRPVVEIGPGSFSALLFAMASSREQFNYIAVDQDPAAIAALGKIAQRLHVQITLTTSRVLAGDEVAHGEAAIALLHSLDDLFVSKYLWERQASYHMWGEALDQFCASPPPAQQVIEDFVRETLLRLPKGRVLIQHYVRPREAPEPLRKLDKLICQSVPRLATATGLKPLVGWEQNYYGELAFARD